jgi:2-polyprenyl-3-methyl-5-hydroxy-6-metoxy-1,4-benzoquinol methylase
MTLFNPKQKSYVAPSGEPDPDSSYAIVLSMIGSGKRVLEFGCATGYLSGLLRRRNCRVTGIEINQAAAAAARESCEEVIVADLDTRPLVDLLPAAQFDAAIFGDVLEHLRDPWRVLDETRSFLTPDAIVVLSIPNVAHGAVRLALLQGDFDYQPDGLLDDTHLRFFTLKTVRRLCLLTGYEIDAIERTKVPMFDSGSTAVPYVKRADFDPALVASIEADPEHDTLQFLVKARPLSDERKSYRLVSGVIDAEEERARSEARLAELEARVAASEAFAREAQETAAGLQAEIESLTAENQIVSAQLLEGEAALAAAIRDAESGPVLADDLQQQLAALLPALEVAQRENAELSAELARRGNEDERSEQIAALQVALDTLHYENAERIAELESLRRMELEFPKVRQENEALSSLVAQYDAEKASRLDERQRSFAALADLGARVDRLTRERDEARAERNQAERNLLSRLESELVSVREEIALTDIAIQRVYRSKVWALRLLLDRIRRRGGR